MKRHHLLVYYSYLEHVTVLTLFLYWRDINAVRFISTSRKHVALYPRVLRLIPVFTSPSDETKLWPCLSRCLQPETLSVEALGAPEHKPHKNKPTRLSTCYYRGTAKKSSGLFVGW